MAPPRCVVALFAIGLAFGVGSLVPLAQADASGDNELLFQPAMVQRLNAHPKATWVAGYNERVHSLTKAQYRRLLGAYRNPPKGVLPVKKPTRRSLRGLGASMALPKNFDAREKWSHCPTIGHIRDQGHCGSCWAFGAVEVLSDRFCIHRNESVDLSTEDLLSCCGVLCGDGCEGGWPYKAWLYFKRSGVVTESCEPYFDQAGCKHPGCEPVQPTPACSRQCASDELWGPAKHFAADAYTLEPLTEDIMLELYENGPLEVDFSVYEDFVYYKSGVYVHLEGDVVGGHAVKLVGWGTTDDGVDYWLIANSWNKAWGEDGYFRIRRGTNECGIEEDVVGGLPSSRHVKESVTNVATA